MTPEEHPPGRVVLVATTHRVAPGLLSWVAWSALRAADEVWCADPDDAVSRAVAAAGVVVQTVRPGSDPASTADQLHQRAAAGRSVGWLASPEGDLAMTRALGEAALRDGSVEIELVHGSYDLPGYRLLDLVATMDRLRSPGGCPWDAEQSHASLAPYVLEEAYEVRDAIDDGDLAGLREELGDLLLQVVFHARLAEELPVGSAWSIDDVAAGIVAKLIRRHPHVFGDVDVSGADEVVANWEVIKTAEKGRTSVTEGVPRSLPALLLAAELVRAARRLAVPEDLWPGGDALGPALFHIAAAAQQRGEDAEAALRGVCRDFRDRLAAVERAARDAGVDLGSFDASQWRERWVAG